MAPTLPLPLILVNFKTYPQTRGARAVRLAQAAGRVARELDVSIAVAPAAFDLAAVARAAPVPVLAQHIDPAQAGKSTGAMTAEHAAEVGAVGAILNHSEKPLPWQEVAASRALCAKHGLLAVVCAAGVPEARRAAAVRPEFVAIEPPDLIGGDISVSTARPEVVSDGVKAVRAVARAPRVLCGAGVKNGADVARALELGARGVLVASGVTLAPRPAAALRDLARGLRA